MLSVAQVRTLSRAWGMLRNMVSFDSASRIRPLKLSTNPFCMGLPGAMNAARCPVWRQRLRSRCRSVRGHCRTRSCLGCRVARSDGPVPGQHAVGRSMCPVAPRDIPGSRRRRRSGCGTGGRRPADRGRNRATSGRWAAPRPGSGHMCRWPCAGHGQPFLSVEPVDAVDPGHLFLPAQQHEQAPIPEPATFICQIAQPPTQLRLRWPARPIPDRLAVRPDDPAGPPLRQTRPGPQMRDGFTLDGGAYHSLPATPSSPPHRASAPPAASSAWSSRPQALSAVWHPTELGLPGVEGTFRHPVLAAQAGAVRARLMFGRTPDDLFF